MTPKEKAAELVGKYKRYAYCDWRVGTGFDDNQLLLNAKQCALIAVEEILKACQIELIGSAGKFRYTEDYWNEVKTEIEKL